MVEEEEEEEEEEPPSPPSPEEEKLAPRFPWLPPPPFSNRLGGAS